MATNQFTGTPPGGADGAGAEFKSQEMLLNMGPQHPSTHGVLRLVLTLKVKLSSNVRRSLATCTGASRRFWKIAL